ncbi:hypothetical protein [Coprobacter fastidiosus]|uniref:hypothetical protein n=1 Tax=Coprobacter fastidiosus TaxID=1099853 RepID=UPI00266EF3CE|nr:hypothetical protein [Coprobacter fastidiosus]
MSNRQYNNIEDTIRNWLAQNLSFITPELSLIRTEFPLPDHIGSKGFIDILAKDVFNNFVIIEVKRANNSARDTITEILKYHALIKQKYKAKDGEIRIIIISTHWSEIIRAFSELVNNTTYAIKGYKIEIDPVSFIPYSIEEQQALPPNIFDRHFPRTYSLNLFYTKEKRELFRQTFESLCAQAHISDYVIIYMDSTHKIIYPYASVFTWQKMSDTKLIKKIGLITGNIFENETDSYETKEEYTQHLEEELIIALCKKANYDASEAGYPEKFDAELSAGNWMIPTIYKYGIFADDPRYNNEMLISEIKGLDGNSYERYSFIGESSQEKRITEALEKSINCLSNTEAWYQLISFRLKQILIKKEKVRIGLYIYNPQSTLRALAFAATLNYEDYAPFYHLIIVYTDQPTIEIYNGDIAWNGKKNNYSILNRKSSPFDTLMKMQLGLLDDELILTLSNLYFSSKKIVIQDGNSIFNSYIKYDEDTDSLVIDKRDKRSISDYYKQKPNIIEELISIYRTYSNYI